MGDGGVLDEKKAWGHAGKSGAVKCLLALSTSCQMHVEVFTKKQNTDYCIFKQIERFSMT